MARRMLIGDDNKISTEILAEFAQRYDWVVDVGNTPQEMIDLTRRGYDVIVTDLEYSACKTEGFDVLRSCRDYAPIRILYTAAHLEDSMIAKAKECGATHIFGKTELENRLHRLIKTPE